MRILVTGGAGYIGRYVLRAAAEAGCEAFWLDRNATFGPGLTADLCEEGAGDAIRALRPDGIIHLAAHSSVAESVGDPGKYARNVEMCRELQAFSERIPTVLASSAAVYGEGGADPLDEGAAIAPASPYGWSKYASELMLPQATKLRLFNVAGGAGDRGDHLIPNAVAACAAGRAIRLNGDGQAVRDFVHVEDVARAFVAAVLARSVGYARVLNICSGEGRTAYDAANLVCALARPGTFVEWSAERPGDVRRLVGDNAAARGAIGWTPERRFEDIVASAIGSEPYEVLLERAAALSRAA